MNNGLCPECGHDVLVLHGDDGCHMIIDESWDGEDESVFYCDCELTPCEIELMFERDEARKLAAMLYYRYADNLAQYFIDDGLGERRFKWCPECGGEIAVIGRGEFRCAKCEGAKP